MRYYDVRVLDTKSGNPVLHFSSYPNGPTATTSGLSAFGITPLSLGVPGFNVTPYDPQALNVVFDCYVYSQATPMGNSWITIEGVPQSILTNAQQYAGQYLEFRGGMGSNGLPLANPKQAGLLVAGNVYQVFGNWTGTQVDITFVVQGSNFTIGNPGNIVLTWPAGTPLATALKNTLATAYPKATLRIDIANIVLSHDEWHACPTLTGLAKLLSDITSTDVQISINGAVITVWDATYKPTPKQLEFTDFVGQPQWINQNVIQIRTVLRADIGNRDYLLMPQGFSSVPGFVQTQAASLPSSNKYTSAIQGKFAIQNGIRHVGNFRQPNGNAWITVINAATVPA